MKLLDKKVMIALFLSMFVAIEIGDQLAGLLIRMGVTANIYGLAGLLAHCIVGFGYGYAFSKAPADRLNLLVLMLLPMALVCGAMRSAVIFILDDRIFYIHKWLTYVMTSRFGFQWLIVMPAAAYFAAKQFAKRTATEQTTEGEFVGQSDGDRKRQERKAQVLETSKGISAKFAKDNLVWRLAHGLGIGFTVTTLADLIHPPLVLIVLTYLISVGLTFRAIKYSSAVSQGWLLASLAILYVTVHSLFVVGQISLMIVLLPASAICLFVSRRFAKKTE